MPTVGDDRRGLTPEAIEPFLDQLDLPVFVVGDDGRLVFANQSWSDLFGASGPGSWAVLSAVSPADRHSVRSAIEVALTTGRRGIIDFSAHRKSGEVLALSCSLNPYSADATGEGLLVGVCWDLTDQRRQEERLAFMAGHDALTGLANRRAFEEALDRAVSRAQRGSKAVLLFLDMDNLKRFNDSRGHLEGDQALVNLSLLLRHHVRSGDLPARIGGDEFAVLLEGADIDDAEEIAERVRAAVASEEFVAGARESGLGISGGIVAVEEGVGARVLLDRADGALYAAKQRGRDRVLTWSPELTAGSSTEWMTSQIRTAFAEDDFCLLYQPVVRLSDGKVAYFESLVRMRDRKGRLLCPEEFLPVVERLGLMPNLTQRVLDLALWQLLTVPAACLSMNLSRTDIMDDALLEKVADALESAHATRGRLLFEIDESTLTANMAGSRVWMERLSGLGARFVLDRFGTGVGMFVLLREPRIEQVKLSHTVMRAMAAEEGNKSFVKALRELIESQGKLAVAGYLENDELIDDVKTAGFEWGQGFHLHAPTEDLGLLMEQYLMVGSADGTMSA